MKASRTAYDSHRGKRRPTKALRRAGAAAALPLAIVVAAVAIAAAGSTGGVRTAAATIRAAGAVTMTNSKAPGAILTAGGMKPGGSVQGQVTITNSGDPATYVLTSSNLSNTAGPLSGPPLSGRLQLLVQDITGATPALVYSGAFGAMPSRTLGNFAANEARTYRFTVTLPNGGPASSDTTGDNVYQGASSSLQFDWTATGSSTGGGGGGTDGGTGGATAGTGGTATGGGTTGGGGTVGGAGGQGSNRSVLKLKYSKKQKAKNGIAISATCLVNCTATFSGSVSVPGASRPYALTKVTKSLRAGKATTVRLKLSSKVAKAVQKALAKHKKVTATLPVTIRGSQASSQRVTVTLTR
jgi:spore coat-associated protein N